MPQIDYIIVQAGGKGSRMEEMTKNKPKALVPVHNLPMIFHLFRKYPDKKFIVVGDYKYDVLERYLHAFADVSYELVCATGRTGTCSGLREALTYIPEQKPLMLIWCDLVLPEDYELPDGTANVIGLSKDFPCRWKYENKEFVEEKSFEYGVAGLFVFQNKAYLEDVPAEGEFVRWLKEKHDPFEAQSLYRTREYGLKSEWDKLERDKCRPFNTIQRKGDKLYKLPLDEQGRALARLEAAWYKQLKGHHFPNIPAIYEYEPLGMEFIEGRNIYECAGFSMPEKKHILENVVECLKRIHALAHMEADHESYYDAYISKTFDRLAKVRDLVPFAQEAEITINGRKCRNVFYHRERLENLVMRYLPDRFCLIHGDCTFSNIMLRPDNTPVLIDPRGYFGHTELYGDPAYDWAKLYYSVIGNYDQFNLKQFSLDIDEEEIRLSIKSNQWEDMEDCFFDLVGEGITREQMRLFLAITWLSLTTYAWQDYDSVCGAFYNGLWYLEEVL